MRRIWPVILLLSTAAAHAGNRTSYAGPADVNLLNRPLGSAPSIMLYFSHAIGGGGGSALSKPSVGLRLNRMHLVSGNFKPDAPDPMQTHELINWHFGRGANNRIELGRRVSWNLGNQTFGRHSEESDFTVPDRAALSQREPVTAAPAMARAVDPSRLVIDPATMTQRPRSVEPLDVRANPFELRLDRHAREAQDRRHRQTD
jgi:hypothetical protein